MVFKFLNFVLKKYGKWFLKMCGNPDYFLTSLVLLPTFNTHLYLSNTCTMSTKHVRKTLHFDESECKYVDEIDQDTPASLA